MIEPILAALAVVWRLALPAMVWASVAVQAEVLPVAPVLRGDPVPVVLVPGWLDTARDLAALRIRFVAAGWPSTHIETVSFLDPTGGNRGHAEELAAAVRDVMDRTGASAVDVVAHSMGGLAVRWYMLEGGGANVRRVVFMATPHRGTMSAHLAWGEGRVEMMPGSDFLRVLNAAPAVPDGVEAATVRTPVDTHVVPAESGLLEGVADHEVCCPTHAGLLHDEQAFRVVLSFLEGLPPKPD